MANSNLFYYRADAIPNDPRTLTVDVCVYGGNASGVVSALQASQMGHSVVLLEQSGRLGGLTTGGLSETDFGNKGVIGGLSRRFYGRVGAHYGVEEEWKFEPKVASQVIEEMARESGAEVLFRRFLKSVEMDGQRIVSIELEGGLRVRASMFLDCTYEGDLMAMANCSFHVGRESNATYNETINGAQIRKTHQFDLPVSPYVRENDPDSGLLPGIEAQEPQIGEADSRMQAYNFRLCLTQKADNRIAYEAPEGYDRNDHILLERYLRAGWPLKDVMRKFDRLRGEKCDKNNHGGVSTDFIGGNWGPGWTFPTASYAEREANFQAHVRYQKGVMYFMGNDASVPSDIRAAWNEWGLCRDEFVEFGGWSPALYVREGRRLVGDAVVTEADCIGQRTSSDSVGMGSYTMDSHNCTRFARDFGSPDARVLNEGDVQIPAIPYGVSYRAIVPARGECENLLVPVCCSTSHIAFGSLRMEPVFMLLGQSAATAASLAIRNSQAVQDVDYAKLRAKLEEDGQVLEA